MAEGLARTGRVACETAGVLRFPLGGGLVCPSRLGAPQVVADDSANRVVLIELNKSDLECLNRRPGHFAISQRRHRLSLPCPFPFRAPVWVIWLTLNHPRVSRGRAR